ncbi:hypothetical protein IKG16_02385 [Candidatus Saccharibacteria bacterium]|nr:hypothetical protein [Candidatus Saccharibacteria bacterium]
MTSTPSTELGLGDVTAKIGNIDLTNCTEITNNNYRGATCTLPGGLTLGAYTVELTSSWHSSTYTWANKFYIYDTVMQDFTSAECDSMPTSTAESYNYITAMDSRDNKFYKMSKLADGHCWMIDNLALDGMDASGNVRTLTPADSNVTTSRPLAVNIENGTPAEYDVVQIYSGAANLVTDTCNLETNPYCIVNTTTKYGNLYNWNAATAGVGKYDTPLGATIYESVCPKGWRLPDIVGDFGYENLFGKYSLPTGYSKDGSAAQALQQAPFNFTLSGLTRSADDNMYYNAGLTGSYISRVASNGDNGAYQGLGINSMPDGGGYVIRPGNGNDKRSGRAVRCVFGGQPDEIMQNFTVTQCTNLAESTAEADNRKTMIDSRDGKFYTISKLADGNCWMTSNLALDGMDGLGAVRTLTTADSNVTTNRTLAINITDPTQMNARIIGIYSGEAESVDSYGSKFGNNYNYKAFTAGLGNNTSNESITESVCPKGWRLPDGSGNFSYTHLVSNLSPAEGGIYPDATTKIQQQPLFFPLAGFDNGSGGYHQKGISGDYATRTSVSNITITILAFNVDNGGFYPQGAHTYGKSFGYSVRCVFGS